MDRDRDPIALVLCIATIVAVLAAVGAVFLYAPREATMGETQRIFYFHVASAWVGFFAFLVTLVGSALYLARRERRWDILALSSVEVGLTFITMTVITGSLWARPVWGTYWTWEPRLTVSAVQLLIYVAYGMLRRSIDDPDRRARLSAVYGIAAFVTVPLSWFAIRWWRTIHPDILTGGGGMTVAPRMVHALLLSIAALTLLYATLLRLRMRIERDGDMVSRLRRQIEERKGV